MRQNPRNIQFTKKDREYFDEFVKRYKEALKEQYTKRVLTGRYHHKNLTGFSLPDFMAETIAYGEDPERIKAKEKRKLQRKIEKSKAKKSRYSWTPEEPKELSQFPTLKYKDRKPIIEMFKITTKIKSSTNLSNFSGWYSKSSGSGWSSRRGQLRIEIPNIRLPSIMTHSPSTNEITFKPEFKEHMRGLRRLYFHELTHAKDLKDTEKDSALYSLAASRSFTDYYRDPKNDEYRAHLGEYSEMLDWMKADPQLKADLMRELSTKPFEEAVNIIFSVVTERNPLKQLTINKKLLAPYLTKLIELKTRLKENGILLRKGKDWIDKMSADRDQLRKDIRSLKRKKKSYTKEQKKLDKILGEIKAVKAAPKQYKKDTETLKQIKDGKFTGWRSELKTITGYETDPDTRKKVWMAAKRSTTRSHKQELLAKISGYSLRELKKFRRNIDEGYVDTLRAIYQMLQEKDLLPRELYGHYRSDDAILFRQSSRLRDLKLKRRLYLTFSPSERRVIDSLQNRFFAIQNKI